MQGQQSLAFQSKIQLRCSFDVTDSPRMAQDYAPLSVGEFGGVLVADTSEPARDSNSSASANSNSGKRQRPSASGGANRVAASSARSAAEVNS